MRLSGLLFYTFFLITLGCKPTELNNPSDPNSNSFFLTAVFTFIFPEKFSFIPNKLESELGVNTTLIAIPSRKDIAGCKAEPNLPTEYSLKSNGEVELINSPSATFKKTEFRIKCLTPRANVFAEGVITLETKGIDWVKNLSLTGAGLESDIRDVELLNNNEIYFLGLFTNNNSNMASDFGTSVTTQSFPTAGTSSSPIIFKLDSQGNLLSTRVLGGNDARRITMDDSGNQYVLSTFSNSVITANPDPAFGGTAINKNPSNPNGDFLFSKVNYDGSFQFARTLTANTLTDANAICFSKTDNKIYVTGRVNGTTGNLGTDFGSNDPISNPLGFIIESSLDGSFIRSRKFSGSTHRINVIKCNPNGGYSFVTNQVSTSLDYRLTYDGLNDIKNLALPNASSITKITSGDLYQFTKNFLSSSGIEPYGHDIDKDGNMLIGIQGNVTSIDLRSGVDGGNDNKTALGGMEIFIVKLNSDGSYKWGKRIGGNLSDNLSSVKVRPSDGHVFVLGTFGGGGANDQALYQDLGSELTLTRPSNNENPFLVELDGETGNFVRHIPIAISSSFTTFSSMYFDADENLYLGGQFRGDTSFRYSFIGKQISKTFSFGNNRQGIFIRMRP